MLNLAWGITGASDHLEATFDEMEKIAALEDVRITTFISQPGIELILYFGLKGRLEAMSNGDPYREICTPKTHGASAYLACRFFAGDYEVLFIGPCTSNTLCKLRYGIADTTVTNAAAWALKGGCSVFALQTHLRIGTADNPFYVRVKDEDCQRCDDCPPEHACRYDAIARKKKFPIINLLKCRRCGDCVSPCPYGAVVGQEHFRLHKRMVDQDAAEALSKVKNMAVLTETRQIFPTLQRYAVSLPGFQIDG